MEEVEKCKNLAFERKKSLEEEKERFQKAAFAVLDMLNNRDWKILKSASSIAFFFFSFRLYCNQRVFYSMYRFRYMHKKYTQILENMLCITTHKIFRYNWTCCPEIVWVSLHFSKNKQVIVFSQSINFFNLWTISHENHASSCAKFFLCIKFDTSLLSLTH